MSKYTPQLLTLKTTLTIRMTDGVQKRKAVIFVMRKKVAMKILIIVKFLATQFLT